MTHFCFIYCTVEDFLNEKQIYIGEQNMEKVHGIGNGYVLPTEILSNSKISNVFFLKSIWNFLQSTLMDTGYSPTDMQFACNLWTIFHVLTSPPTSYRNLYKLKKLSIIITWEWVSKKEIFMITIILQYFAKNKKVLFCWLGCFDFFCSTRVLL